MGILHITQYLRPDGRKKPLTIEVSDDISKLAEDMILSCEVLQTGQIAVYCRHKHEIEEDELCLIAENVRPEDKDQSKSPTVKMIELIKQKSEQNGNFN